MKNKSLTFFFFLGCSTFVHAQFYVAPEISVTYWQTDDTRDVNGAHEGFGLGAGYEFWQGLAAEAFWKKTEYRTPHFDLGEDGSNPRLWDEHQAHLFGLGARYRLKWLSMTAGLSTHRSEKTRQWVEGARPMTGPDKQSGANPYFGLGLEVPRYQSFAPYVEVTRFKLTSAELWYFGIGVRLKMP